MIIKLSKIDFGGGTCTGSSECVLTTATFTSNATYNPPSGVNGFKKVTVNVDLDAPYNSGFTAGFSSGYTSGETAGYASGYTSGETVGYASGETAGAAAQKALLGATSFTANDTYTSENGWSSVTVNVPQVSENKLNKYWNGEVTALTESDFSGITGLYPYMFAYNGYQSIFGAGKGIKSIVFPASVSGISDHVFSHCDMLTDVEFKAPELGNFGWLGQQNGLFEGCAALSGLTGFEKWVGQGQSNMFNGCYGLSGDFRLGCTAMTAAGNMFAQCTGITSFTFVNNVTGFTRTNIFTNCSSVTRVDFTNNTVVADLTNVATFSAFTANYEIWVHESLYDTWIATSPWDTISSHIVSKSTRTT